MNNEMYSSMNIASSAYDASPLCEQYIVPMVSLHYVNSMFLQSFSSYGVPLVCKQFLQNCSAYGVPPVCKQYVVHMMSLQYINSMFSLGCCAYGVSLVCKQ